MRIRVPVPFITLPLVVVGTVALAVIARSTAPERTTADDRSLKPIRLCGRNACVGEERFRWHGVTAFGLADLVADGRDAEARAFVRWARDTGFNVVRVLAMLPGGWLDLSAADGRRVLPRLFEMTREHGLHVQVVALANTNEPSRRHASEGFQREQVREVGRLCAAAGNCVLELANEPYHGSQARLDDPALMRRLQQETPRQLPVAWGAASQDLPESMTGGTFVVVHLGRSGDRWTRVARLAGLAALSAATGKFVVDNEPIGAAETPEPDRRDSAPEFFFAQGALSRLVEVGSTFHCQDCLTASVPGPVQRQCATAFMEGRRIIPDNVTVSFADGEVTPSPVTLPAGGHDRLFSGVAGDRAWAIVLGEGAAAATLRWQSGWRPEKRLAARPGVEVWSAVR